MNAGAMVGTGLPMLRLFVAVISLVALPSLAAAQVAPLPPEIAPSGQHVWGLYAHAIPETPPRGDAQTWVEERQEACRAKGRSFRGPTRQMWLYATTTERIVFIEWRTETLDADGCVTATALRHGIDRSVRQQGAWLSEDFEPGRWRETAAWPFGFGGVGCFNRLPRDRCEVERRFGAEVRCHYSGNYYFEDTNCVGIRGPARGLLVFKHYQADDGEREDFYVDALTSHGWLDRAVFERASGWCAYRTPIVTSPCAPDRPGNTFERADWPD